MRCRWSRTSWSSIIRADLRHARSLVAATLSKAMGSISMRTWRIAMMTAALIATPTSEIRAQDRSQARSMVISQYGVVAAEHPSGTRAGVAVLQRGGNAVDAAIAATAALC